MTKRVLIIAYAFPPIGGIGIVRTVQFAKYLPQFGWEPVILTVDGGNDYLYDEALAEALAAKLKIYRARSWEPLNAQRVKRTVNRFEGKPVTENAGGPTLRNRVMRMLKSFYFSLRVPDDKIGWLPFAVPLGKRVIQAENIDLLFPSAPPFTNFLVAHQLHKWSKKPLVVDYRDEWSTMRYRDFPLNPVTDRINQRLERGVLRSAGAVITATQPIAENLRNAQLLPPTTLHANITNGFDPEDYSAATVARPRNPVFTIVYTGTFYGRRQTPEYFLRGLHQLLQQRPELRSQLSVRFVGSIFEKHASLIPELGLTDIVQLCGVVPRQQAIEAQLSADLLLLVVGKGAGSEVVLTGKVFEYLGAGRPILALVPTDGPAAALIRTSATGTVVDAEAVPAIAQALAQAYTDWCHGQTNFTPNRAVIQTYDRRVQTANLAEVFNTLVSKGK